MKKSLFLPVAVFATLGAPIATVVSCGSDSGGGISRYDTEDDGKIEIAATFSATGVQTKALKTIISKYNSYVDGLTNVEKAKGYLKLKELKSVSGGYGKAIDALRKDFTAKNKKNLANIIVDYPSSAAILRSYRMELDLKPLMSDPKFKAMKNKFAPNFWSQNDNIGGLKKGGVYAIPISVSSSANAVNTPLFAHIINLIRAKKANVINLNANDSIKIKELYNKGKTAVDDLNHLRTKWGRTFANEFVWTGKVTDEIFSNWDKLIDFAVAVHNAFGNKDVDNEKQLHLLTFDSPTNVIQMLSYAYANGDMSKFYVVKDKDGYVDFKFLKDKNSDSYKNFKKSINLLRKGVAAGAVWIGGIGAYGSSLLIHHQSMMSIGSTAGASHWYAPGVGDSSVKKASYAKVQASLNKDLKIKGHSKLVVDNAKFKQLRYINKFYEFADKTKASAYDVILKDGYIETNLKTDLTTGGFSLLIKSEDNSFISFANSNTSNIKLIGTNKSGTIKYYIAKLAIENDAAITGKENVKVISKNVTNNKQIFNIGDILNSESKSTFGKYKNKILPFKSVVKVNKKYDAILIEGYLESDLLLDVTTNGFTYLVSINSSNKIDFEKEVIDKKYIAISKDEKTLYYLIKSTQIETHSPAQSLQESEVEGILPPNKVSSGTKGGVYVQGPSFIPVHANKRENKAVALFIKWFLSDKEYNWNDKKDNKYITKNLITPLKYWLVKANYITPTSDAFSDNSDVKAAIDVGLKNNATKKYWLGVNIAWKIFNKAKNDPNLNPIIQPVDDFSSVARNNVTDVAIKNIYTEAHTDGVISSFEDIYKEMTKLAKSADIL